jgi:hypothetical protein
MKGERKNVASNGLASSSIRSRRMTWPDMPSWNVIHVGQHRVDLASIDVDG